MGPLPCLGQNHLFVIVLAAKTENYTTVPQCKLTWIDFKFNSIILSHFSFPGGKKSVEDSSLEEAALRETQEEIGLDMNLVNVLAFIGPFVDRVSTSNFTMHTSSYSILFSFKI